MPSMEMNLLEFMRAVSLREVRSLAPLFAGRGWGGGAASTSSVRGKSPSPGSSLRDDPTSPRKRGEVKRRRCLDAPSRSLRKRDHGGAARENLVEQHADHADQQNRDDDIGDREVVPL